MSEFNRYIKQFLQKYSVKSNSSLRCWKPTDAVEMEKFYGLIFAIGLMKKVRVQDYYWSTDSVLSTLIFSDTMARHRFKLLLKFRHFSNNEDANGNKLYKLQKIYNVLLDYFQKHYKSSKELSIDVSMVFVVRTSCIPSIYCRQTAQVRGKTLHSL